MEKAESKMIYIFKANELLLEKLAELERFISSSKTAFSLNEKEINKYYSLKDNEKAVEYAKNIDKKIAEFEKKLDEEVAKFKNENSNKLASVLINNYAKEEDLYYEFLNISRKENMSASCLYKTEVNIDMLKRNINFLLNKKEEILNRCKELDEENVR